MCSHWGAHLKWAKDLYGCIPCLPEAQRARAYRALPQSLRQAIGEHNLEPLERVPQLPISRVYESIDPRYFNRDVEQTRRRESIVSFIRAEARRVRKIEIEAALGLHCQTLANDLKHLVQSKSLRLRKLKGNVKVYECIKLV
jgi:hypothetical protein